MYGILRVTVALSLTPDVVNADQGLYCARRSPSRQSPKVWASAQNPVYKAQQLWRNVRNEVDYKATQLKQQFMYAAHPRPLTFAYVLGCSHVSSMPDPTHSFAQGAAPHCGLDTLPPSFEDTAAASHRPPVSMEGRR